LSPAAESMPSTRHFSGEFIPSALTSAFGPLRPGSSRSREPGSSGLQAEEVKVKENETKVPLETCLVREVAIRYRGPGLKAASKITAPRDAVALAQKSVHDDSKEHFLAFYLDGRHRPIARATVSVGTATASLVHPREVFQAAVGVGAVALIILHNHPSGDPTPSTEDRTVTKRIHEAGELLGIRLLDHIIWTVSGEYYAFSEHGDLAG
jgi:DNA repair protein RadC